MTNYQIKQTFSFILFLVSWLLVIPTDTFAQTSVGLSAIPPRLEITALPGKTITHPLKVRNESSLTKDIITTSHDFIVVDDKGTPIQLEKNYQGQNRWAASNWLQISPTKLRLKPGETRILTLTILTPEDALPGGHYAMILHTPQNENFVTSTTGASIQTNVGTLIYLTVPGDIQQNARIKYFLTPSFSEFGPINFQTNIVNLSDIHITPAGSIIIKNWFGGKTSQLVLSNTNIFPYTSRDFDNTLNHKWLFGRYTAKLIATYGTTGQTVSSTLIFWVIPWKLILTLLVIIILTITIIKLLVNRRRPPTTIGPSKEEISG